MLQNRKEHEIMFRPFSRSLIIWETAIETWAQEMNRGSGNELGGQRAKQFPHLGNYILTTAGPDSKRTARVFRANSRV